MSDNFGDVKVGCEEHGYTGRTACPWCEIERLRSDLAVAQSLARTQAEKTVVADKRIEELEKRADLSGILPFDAKGIYITSSKIDAASFYR
jgi:hypothetical protein